MKGIEIVKRYSNEEILSSTETFEKDRKTYFNKVYDSILNDRRFFDWVCQAIEGLIGVSWIKRKNDLLFLKIKKNDIVWQNLSERPESEKTLMNVYEKLQEAKFNCEKGYKKRIEADFDKVLSALKIAQANVVNTVDEKRDGCNEEDNSTLFLSKEELTESFNETDDKDIFTEIDNFKEG